MPCSVCVARWRARLGVPATWYRAATGSPTGCSGLLTALVGPTGRKPRLRQDRGARWHSGAQLAGIVGNVLHGQQGGGRLIDDEHTTGMRTLRKGHAGPLATCGISDRAEQPRAVHTGHDLERGCTDLG